MSNTSKRMSEAVAELVSGGASDAEQLAQLRARIDKVDSGIVELLNERAEVVVKIGELKRSNGGAIYAPHREAEVLNRVLQKNRGPLPDRCIERIYRELMSGSFALERPLRIGYMGPEASFSYVAARLQFGDSVRFENLRNIQGVFEEVRRGHVDYGLVPIENTAGGGIAETMDAFQEAIGQVFVYAEVQTEVRHCLLARCEPEQVRTIYAKPEDLALCRNWIYTQYPDVSIIRSASASQAVESAAKGSDAGQIGVAAVGSKLSGERYGIPVLFESIEDDPNNLTRYLVISREKAERSGHDKTSLMFRISGETGSLAAVLSVFAKAGVSVTHIDKRPSGRRNWTYTFFLDAEGHIDDPNFAQVVEDARRSCEELQVLGSYPSSQRVM